MSDKGKKVTFGKEARGMLADGANKLANAVASTLGPKGKSVVIKPESPTFTRDGVTVAREIDFELGTPEDAGARLIRSVAQKTNDEAGDGTTTATILCQGLLKEGMKAVEMGIDPLTIQAAWLEGRDIVQAELKKHYKPIKTKAEMSNVATISSRDREVGDIIATVYDKIGKEGVVSVEETKTLGMWHEFVEGMELDRGWVSPYFITNEDKMEAEVKNPYVLVTTQSISQVEEIIRLLEKIANTESKSLVIVCDEMKGEALSTVILNKLKGIMNTLVIQAPEYGDIKEAILQDIATVTGAQIISEKTGTRVDEVELEQLGRAEKIQARRGKSVIIGGGGGKKAIHKRMALIKSQMKEEKNSFKKKTLEKRHARMKGGVAVIRIGCVSEAESREKHYRIEDAINATRSSIEEGIVIGGGLALYKASERLNERIQREKNPDYRHGLQILQEAIRRPARVVLENAGEDAGVIISQIKNLWCDQECRNAGYDAGKGKYEPDLIKAGVIDPLKVERVALEQAVSVMGQFLNTEVIVSKDHDSDKDEKEGRRD